MSARAHRFGVGEGLELSTIDLGAVGRVHIDNADILAQRHNPSVPPRDAAISYQLVDQRRLAPNDDAVLRAFEI